LPIIPGHQIVGTVENVGSRRPGSAVGDPDNLQSSICNLQSVITLNSRVGIPWVNSTCGACRFCRSGRENLCENALFTGLNVNGGYAEYTIVGEHFAYPLPDRLSDVETAPLLCAGIIGYRALRLSGAQPSSHSPGRVGLYGFGASAHIALQIAKHWSCPTYVFSRGAEHRRLALELGATWAGTSEETPPDKLGSAIIFAPVGDLAKAALTHLDRGGTVALAGIHSTPIPEIEYPLLYHERSITSVANATREDAIELLRLSAEIPIRTEVQVFPLEQANYALQLLKAGKINGAGVLKVTHSSDSG
jgi:propanol-preferring alcohol dehydrogenase